MTDVAALQAQVDELRAQIASLLPPNAPRDDSEQYLEPVRVTLPPVKIAVLVGSPDDGYLDRDPRVVRQLVEVVALCHGAASPSQEVPVEWMPQLRRLAAARASGDNWIGAVLKADLEVPHDLTAQCSAARRELNRLWDQVLELAGLTVTDLNDAAKDSLLTFLRRVLS